MTSKENLKCRHEVAKAILKKVSEKVIGEHGLHISASIVAEATGVSPQTVINYLSGRTKDGFLTEAITKEYRAFNRRNKL